MSGSPKIACQMCSMMKPTARHAWVWARHAWVWGPISDYKAPHRPPGLCCPLTVFEARRLTFVEVRKAWHVATCAPVVIEDTLVAPRADHLIHIPPEGERVAADSLS